MGPDRNENPASGARSTTAPCTSSMSPSVALRSTVPVFLGNFFYLQSFISPVFGSNGPLWSLSYEFWYYIVFPALVLAAAAWVGIRFRILYAGLALLLFWFIGAQISFYFLIWAGRRPCQDDSNEATKFKSSFPALPWAAGLLFAGALVWMPHARAFFGLITDYIVAFCFALWLYTLLLGSREDASPAYVHWTKKLAGFSYTLYLTHFPALLLLRGLLNPQGNWQPDARHLAYASANCACNAGLRIWRSGVDRSTHGQRTTSPASATVQPWKFVART